MNNRTDGNMLYFPQQPTSTGSLLSQNATSVSNGEVVTDVYCGLYDLHQCEVLRKIKIYGYSLAISFGVITLMLLFLLQKYKHFTERTFIYIMVPNLLNSILKTMNDGHSGIGCVLQAFLSQVCGCCSLFWICIITIYLARLIIPGRLVKNLDQRERLCIAICIGVAVVGACLPLITNDYGPAGVSCFITKTTTSGIIWRYVIWYGPAFVGSVAIFITYLIIYYYFVRMYNAWSYLTKSDKQEGDQRNYRKEVMRTLGPFTAYAISFLVLTILHFTDRTYEVVSTDSSFTLKVIHRTASPCFDITICIVFFVTNGASEFSSEKFRQGSAHHLQMIRRVLYRGGYTLPPTNGDTIQQQGAVSCDFPTISTISHAVQAVDSSFT